MRTHCSRVITAATNSAVVRLHPSHYARLVTGRLVASDVLVPTHAGQLSESMPVARDNMHTAVACKSVRWDEVESPAPCRIAGTPEDRALKILNDYAAMSVAEEDDAETTYSEMEGLPCDDVTTRQLLPPAKRSKSQERLLTTTIVKFASVLM